MVNDPGSSRPQRTDDYDLIRYFYMFIPFFCYLVYAVFLLINREIISEGNTYLFSLV